MFSTHVKAVQDLQDNYSEVVQIIKNRDYVIITNDGKREAAIISYEDLEKYQEYLHACYVEKKLAEVEAVEDNPDEWLPIDELYKNRDKWSAEKNGI